MISLLALIGAALIAQPTAQAGDVAEDNRTSEAACLRAAGLEDAQISAATAFSDTLAIDARIVDGRAPGTDASAPRVKLLCLFHRETGRAETQPFDPDQARSYSRQVRDVWWHAVEMAGRPLMGGELLTLSLGSDGRISGRSGCNLYSAMYRLEGEALEVTWPMTGTRRACLPALMDQELRFRELLLQGRHLQLREDGSLLVTGRDGATLRFVRAEGEMQRPTE